MLSTTLLSPSRPNTSRLNGAEDIKSEADLDEDEPPPHPPEFSTGLSNES